MIENRTEPRISVQRRNAESLVQGHLGTGALVAPGLVVTTRSAAEAIRDFTGQVEVILGPSAFDIPFDGVVERREATLVRLLDVAVLAEPVLQAALVTIEAPSGYLPVTYQDPDADASEQSEVFTQALREGLDVLQAFEAAGLIRPGLYDDPSEDWRNAAEQHLVRHGTQHRRVEVRLSDRSSICKAMPWLWFC